jgi:REP element-mobilizing transposase RayT
MVRWYHAIFTAYGFWLPNDPRGSWSDFVGAWELYKFGGSATKTDTRRSVAGVDHDHRFRQDTKRSLKYPPVRFDEQQRELIGAGIAQACAEAGIGLHALTIGYDHVHAVVPRHARTIEQIVQHFKSRATKQMNAAGLHPLARFADAKGTPTPWAEGCWQVFINDEQQLRAAIEYVERHPAKEGLPPQRYPFISPV